jgi:mannose-6-phosphate isomerase-like protein (cupin superfamily)
MPGSYFALATKLSRRHYRLPGSGSQPEEAIVPASYTHKKLTDVEDAAPKSGFGEFQEARFAKGDLETEHTGVSHHRLKPNKRQPFAHKHEQAEEVYVVLSGSGAVKLDDEIVALETLDAIRVAPGVIRAFEAGPDGLELLACGARHDGDGEVIPGWWAD